MWKTSRVGSALPGTESDSGMIPKENGGVFTVKEKNYLFWRLLKNW